ncbi:triacylglycerol lipase [Gordonia sp. TBRC 11910]|uniref:Triacylglycerol lipase n=1 Tax=Gordonia asplenii TaxID=2725283 RepID=A0A848L814_9ACTN|nr:alpha/beta fold hydrolase [Gordonia asplenii]NMO03718.1 triacylglycerol lipase [Gordonia asplenii]
MTSNCSRRIVRAVLAAGCATTMMLGSHQALAYGAPRYGPAQSNWRSGVIASIEDPDLLPPGMNDAACRVLPGTRPVVLLNGAFLNKYATWSKFSEQLSSSGTCVFGLDYGGPTDGPFHQMGDLRSSAAQIGRFVDHVRAVTGSSKVDLVGYSEGGLVPFYFLNVLGGASKVATLVSLASPVRGMSGYGILDALATIPQASAALGKVLPAAVDGTADSSFVRAITAGGLTRPGVRYVSVSSLADSVVMPAEARLPAASNVTDVVVQHYCPQDQVFHGSIIYDDVALRLVRNALTPDRAVAVTCAVVLPFS